MAGLSSLVYPAPRAVSDDRLEATAAAAKALANAPVRRLARLLGVSALDAVLAATGGTSAASAAQAALTDPSKGGKSRPTTAMDLLPGRPLDSRVVSVLVTNAAGKAVPLASGVFPVSVTVPFRDPSIVKWNAALKTATVDVGNSGFAQTVISVTCPTSPTAAAKGVRASFIRGGIGPAAVLLEAATLVSYTGVIGSFMSKGQGGDAVSAIAAPNGASVGTDVLMIPTEGSGGGGDGTESVGSALSAKAPTVSSAAYTYTLSTDCGPAFGRQSFVCGAGFGGAAIEFECPRVVATPSCLRFNTSRGVWTTAGCAVANTSALSVDCACDSPGDFAVRFAALPQSQTDVFAAGSAETAVTVLGVSYFVGALLAAFVGCNLIGTLVASDAAQTRRWVSRLSADPELAQVAPGALAAPTARTGAKVAPLSAATSDNSPSQTSPSAKVLPISPGDAGDVFAKSTTAIAIGDALAKYAAAFRIAADVSSLSERVGFSADSALLPSSRGAARSRVAALMRVQDQWRAAEAQAVGVSAAGVSKRISPFGPFARAVFCARLIRGDPPAVLLALLPLVRCCRLGGAWDAAASATAAPRFSRLLGAAAAITLSAAGSTVLYAYLVSSSQVTGSPALLGLTPLQVLALGVATAIFIQFPIDAAIIAALRWRARAAAYARFPGLFRELDRRARAAAVLGTLPTSALLRVAAQASHISMSTEEEHAADEGAPPGYEDTFFTPAAAHAEAVASGVSAAFTLGLNPDGAVDDDEMEADARVATAVRSLRAAFEATPPPERPHLCVVVAVDVALAVSATFGAFYTLAFALTRGPVATSSAASAWTFSVFFSLCVVRVVAVALHVVFVFATKGAVRAAPSPSDATQLLMYHNVIARPAAAAAAAMGHPIPIANAASATVDLNRLVVILCSDGPAAAHSALRASALARAYTTLITPAFEDAAVDEMKNALAVTNRGLKMPSAPTGGSGRPPVGVIASPVLAKVPERRAPLLSRALHRPTLETSLDPPRSAMYSAGSSSVGSVPRSSEDSHDSEDSFGTSPVSRGSPGFRNERGPVLSLIHVRPHNGDALTAHVAAAGTRGAPRLLPVRGAPLNTGRLSVNRGGSNHAYS